MTKQLLLTK